MSFEKRPDGVQGVNHVENRKVCNSQYKVPEVEEQHQPRSVGLEQDSKRKRNKECSMRGGRGPGVRLWKP